MIAGIILIIIGLWIGFIAWLILSPAEKETPSEQQQRQLTEAEQEAIRQADEAFDYETYSSIVSGNYQGPLPEHIVGGHWTDLYPDLYHTKIAGINYRKGINDLADKYFEAMLHADPKNEYDPNAIKIINAEDYRHLGFIPASETDAVRKWVNNQLPYPCHARIRSCEDYDSHTFLVGEINIQRPPN